MQGQHFPTMVNEDKHLKVMQGQHFSTAVNEDGH